MPLDTSIIRQATFQPIQFKAPDRVNMLLQAAQAAQAVQGLEAGREERQARLAGRERAAQTQAALQEARKLGHTDEGMLAMSDALIGSGVPDLVNKGITLRESLREAAEYRRAFGGGGAPAGAAAMPAPAGAVATPAPAGVGAPQLTSGVNERGLAFPTTREEADRRWAESQAGAPLPPAMSPVQPLQSIMPPAAAAAAPANAMAPSAPAANRLAAPAAGGDFLASATAAVDPSAQERARLAQLLQHPQKSIRETAAASLSALPGITEEQKKYLTAVRQGFRGTLMDYQTTLRKAGATSLTQKLEGREQAAKGELNVAQYKDIVTAANVARRTLPALETQQRVLDEGFRTGFGTEAQKVGASVLSALGVPEAEKFASNAQVFISAMNQAVLQRQLEQKGTQTAADAQRITATGAQLGNTVEANKFIIAVAKAQLKRDIQQRQFWDSYWNKNKTYEGVESAWESDVGGKSLFDSPELRQYASVSAPTAPQTSPRPSGGVDRANPLLR